MTVRELIYLLHYKDENLQVMLEDSNGFIHDIDLLYTEHVGDTDFDTVLLVAGQLQGGGYEDTGID